MVETPDATPGFLGRRTGVVDTKRPTVWRAIWSDISIMNRS
jgi:hypothetical protein